MRWTAPPERREIILVLFSISVYLLAYNIETSLSYVGIDPVAAQGALFRRIGLGKTKVLGYDGRKPAGWRDRLEDTIFGKWEWEKGQIAGDGTERSQLIPGRGKHGAQWMDKRSARSDDKKRFGDDSVNGAHVWWGEDVPVASVVKHVPGYTILDNVVVLNGTVYLVSDATLPPPHSILDRPKRTVGDFRIINKKEAVRTLGEYGGIVKGVTFMSVTEPHNTTLIDLWRLYSTLDQNIDRQGHTTLAPPTRLIFPHIPFFTDEDPAPEAPEHVLAIPRSRSDTGLHPYLVKAAFPQMVVQYQQDWQDYHKMEVPFVFERIVLADQHAAARSLNPGQPPNSPPYSLEVSRHWWEPVRRTLVTYFDRLDEEARAAGEGSKSFWDHKEKKVITYIDNHAEAVGLGMSAMIPGDYEYFSRSLKKLGRDKGYEVQIVSTEAMDKKWDAAMDVIVRSTVVVGVHGDHLFNAMWMRTSPQATFIELFPHGAFTRDRELVMQSLGIKYIAWWVDDNFTGDKLPAPTSESNEPIHINTNEIMKTIHRILQGKENPQKKSESEQASTTTTSSSSS